MKTFFLSCLAALASTSFAYATNTDCPVLEGTFACPNYGGFIYSISTKLAADQGVAIYTSHYSFSSSPRIAIASNEGVIDGGTKDKIVCQGKKFIYYVTPDGTTFSFNQINADGNFEVSNPATGFDMICNRL